MELSLKEMKELMDPRPAAKMDDLTARIQIGHRLKRCACCGSSIGSQKIVRCGICGYGFLCGTFKVKNHYIWPPNAPAWANVLIGEAKNPGDTITNLSWAAEFDHGAYFESLTGAKSGNLGLKSGHVWKVYCRKKPIPDIYKIRTEVAVARPQQFKGWGWDTPREDQLYMIRNGFCGNVALFWRKGGQGYCENIEEAELFTWMDAVKILRECVGHKFTIVPAALVERTAVRVFSANPNLLPEDRENLKVLMKDVNEFPYTLLGREVVYTNPEGTKWRGEVVDFKKVDRDFRLVDSDQNLFGAHYSFCVEYEHGVCWTHAAKLEEPK